jgi:formylglycine-generating enzyme required for sulfatase activity
MMRRAARSHGLRGALLAGLLAALTLAGLAVRADLAERRQADRAAGLVRGLLGADLAQVPGIVTEIGGYRRWADGRLREAAAEAEAQGDAGRRLRASLALLPVDPGQADYLCGRLLDAAPAEVAILREALAPHREELRERLWAAVEQPPRGHESQRLRAACALAAYDSDSPRWDQAGAAVVAQLVAENPVYLAYWLEGFRPVRPRLLAPLARVFRDRHPERAAERGLATNLLADYAADQPALLANLVMDADDKQFATLYPKLQATGGDGQAPLRAELQKQVQPRWEEALLDPSWHAPAAELVRRIEAAQGLVAERFALCQTLPLAELRAVAEGLKPCGYRPVRVRPYAVGAGVQVAVVWQRDGRACQLVQGVSAEDIQKQDRELQPKGFRPADVAGYRDGGQERYAAVWLQGSAKEDVRLYVGVPEAQHRAAWQPLQKAELRPVTLHTFTAAEGQVRCSGIWRRDAPGAFRFWGDDGRAFNNDFWGDDEATFADRGLSDGLPVDVSLLHGHPYPREVQGELLAWLTGSPWAGLALRTRIPLLPQPGRRYTGVFHASAAFDHAEALGLTPVEQLDRARELARQDYRPAALAVTAFAAGSLRTAAVWHRPVVADVAREDLAKRQANAAVALLRLGHAELVWPLLQHRPDPRLRSYLLHRLGPLGADPRALVQRLETEPDVSERRALLLSLGEFGPEQLPAADRAALVPSLLRLYREEPDAGLHAAAEWLLRQWREDGPLRAIDQALATGRVEGRRQWYVTKQGQTFVVIPGSAEFIMGSPRTEAGRESGAEGWVEMPHRRQIGRPFALAAKEVTVAQFLSFRRNHAYNKQYAPSGEHPVNVVSWYDAAAYCNWLSGQEGIPEEEWCYEPNAKGDYAEGMRPKAGYLGRTGYRLPTEAEWEYACRAGALTARPYGETDELLGKYAWYATNSQTKEMLAPGQFKPNDWGFLDLLGNALEWVQDPVFYYPRSKYGRPIEDKEDTGYLSERPSRVLRGGAFTYRPVYVRSAVRLWNAPAYRDSYVGFRPARTYR